MQCDAQLLAHSLNSLIPLCERRLITQKTAKRCKNFQKIYFTALRLRTSIATQQIATICREHAHFVVFDKCDLFWDGGSMYVPRLIFLLN